jgi:hypothetical protein
MAVSVRTIDNSVVAGPRHWHQIGSHNFALRIIPRDCLQLADGAYRYLRGHNDRPEVSPADGADVG